MLLAAVSAWLYSDVYIWYMMYCSLVNQLLSTSLWIRKFYEAFIQTQMCCNFYSYIKEITLRVDLSSVFIQWLSDDNSCRVFQVVISCYRMWRARRCARDEKGPLYKHRRPVWKTPPSCSLDGMPTRQETVWVH
jgi:hypothetical protein